MKASQFNTFFPYNDIAVGYNSLENDFIFLTSELFELFEYIKKTSVNDLEKLHPDFWELLKNKKFIIEDNIDEIQKVKDFVFSIDRNLEQYHLMINPTLNCNFKCWYCYETHIKGSKMNDHVIENIKKHIHLKLNEGKIKHFTISWFGGEPLMYYNQIVKPILEFSKEICALEKIPFNSNFTTNGYFINDTMLNEFKELAIDGMQITLDGHRERHNAVRFTGKNGSYDKIIENIKKCVKNNIEIVCRINVSKETLNSDLTKILHDFSDLSENERHLLIFSFNKVWQETDDLHKNILDIIFNKIIHDSQSVNLLF